MASAGMPALHPVNTEPKDVTASVDAEPLPMIRMN
jgi:hypothetical protein